MVFGAVVRQLLGDAQQRIVFRAQVSSGQLTINKLCSWHLCAISTCVFSAYQIFKFTYKFLLYTVFIQYIEFQKHYYTYTQ